ncbi:hypothetical protein [Wolbachia endosymbiont of Leptopilina clavipes]
MPPYSPDLNPIEKF